jgi:hypothetical protein
VYRDEEENVNKSPRSLVRRFPPEPIEARNGKKLDTLYQEIQEVKSLLLSVLTKLNNQERNRQ